MMAMDKKTITGMVTVTSDLHNLINSFLSKGYTSPTFVPNFKKFPRGGSEIDGSNLPMTCEWNNPTEGRTEKCYLCLQLLLA